MSATVRIVPVFANGPTGELEVTVVSDDHGDSLRGYVKAVDVLGQARRALGIETK